MELTKEQALDNLYLATTKALLTKEEHDFCAKCAMTIKDSFTPKEEKLPPKK